MTNRQNAPIMIGQNKFADMAQEVEHVLGKDGVGSSSLPISSTIKRHPKRCLFSWPRQTCTAEGSALFCPMGKTDERMRVVCLSADPVGGGCSQIRACANLMRRSRMVCLFYSRVACLYFNTVENSILYFPLRSSPLSL